MSLHEASKTTVYRRLDSFDGVDTNALINAEITPDLFENRYNPNQFKTIPWKGIFLAIFLFLTGSILLSFGILILTHVISVTDQGQGLF